MKKKKKSAGRVFLSSENIDEIMSCALDGGINHWCDRIEIQGRYMGEYIGDQISRGGRLGLHDVKKNAQHVLTKEKFRNGFRMYIEAGNRECLMIETDDHLDCGGRYIVDAGMIDTKDADAIVQYGLFGDVVYEYHRYDVLGRIKVDKRRK